VSSVEYAETGGVGTILLNRPEKKNALDSRLILELQSVLQRAEADGKTRIIALRGAGADFCAGADLAELASMQQLGPAENLADARKLGDFLLQLRRCRKPVVAVVHGRALAGGCGLATACDIVLAHENAQFGYPEVHLGFVAAMVMAILRRKVAEALAFELLTRGDRIDAREAARIGVVNKVFPAATFGSDVTAYLVSLAERPASALELTKRLFYGLDGTSVEQGIARGAEVNATARLTDACKEGVRRFLERSKDSSRGPDG
jgi:methylglutaconyl-CoA hydratase